MKKEKGFTLIELLAVIIILGILMMVAIPAVTTYINSSRKSAYIDNVKQFISAASTAVTSGGKIEFYDEEALLMVPVGVDDAKSIVKLEKGGQSPYSSTYYFAYVGIVYDGENYDYYFTAVDNAGQGLFMSKLKDIEKKGGGEALIQTGLKSASKLVYTKTLQSWYKAATPKKFAATTTTGFETCPTGVCTGSGSGENALKPLIEPAGGTAKIKYILVCGYKDGAAFCPQVDDSNSDD